MEEFIKEAVASMKELGLGDDVDKARWYFENIALSYRIFTDPKTIVKEMETDPLVPYKYMDGIITQAGFENPYTLTPDMAKVERIGKDEKDRVAIIQMPEPRIAGHAHTILIYTDENYDYPGYFVVVLGANDTTHIIAWDLNSHAYDLGLIVTPETVKNDAYTIYFRQRAKAMTK